MFSTIRHGYLVLFYIKIRRSHPDEKLYLADAAEMGVKVTRLSKGIEKLRDQGCNAGSQAGSSRTYVELTSKAVELMAENAIS